MYRCKECNKIYPSRVQYCECGSSEFVTIQPKSKQQPKKELKLDSNQIISWSIFAVCLIAAVVILCL